MFGYPTATRLLEESSTLAMRPPPPPAKIPHKQNFIPTTEKQQRRTSTDDAQFSCCLVVASRNTIQRRITFLDHHELVDGVLYRNHHHYHSISKTKPSTNLFGIPKRSLPYFKWPKHEQQPAAGAPQTTAIPATDNSTRFEKGPE